MYLYVIGTDDTSPVKIGFSKHPEKRLKQLQTSCSQPLVLFHKEELKADAIRQYERVIHRELGYLKMKGEWFNLNPKDAALQVKHLRIFFEGNEDMLKYH